MEIEVRLTLLLLNLVRVVLVFVKVEDGVDGVFVNHEGVRFNIVGGHHVVSMLFMIASKQLSKAAAEVFCAAGLIKFLVELEVAFLLVGHVRLVLSVVVVFPSLISVAAVLGLRVLEVALFLVLALSVVIKGVFVLTIF